MQHFAVQVVAYGTKLYIVGGIENHNTECMDTLYSYDPVQQNFSRLASMPRPSCRGGAAVLDGSIYVTSGLDSADATGGSVCGTVECSGAYECWSGGWGCVRG